MIVKLTEEMIPAFTAVCAWEHVYGSKMVTCLKTYGLETERHHFYLCTEDGEPAAAMYSDGSILTVTSNGKVNPAEVKEIAEEEQVSEIKQILLDKGALGACMTGTGSTVFGLFDDEASARKAAGVLNGQCPDVFVCQSL